MREYEALVLVSFGGPEKPEDVMPFLRTVTAGRAVPETRLAEVAEHYYNAGGVSPINARCRELLGALGRELAHLPLRLYWGNRNWAPLLTSTVAQMRDDGVHRALALVTSAYGGYSSCRQYLDDIASARAAIGPGAPEIDKLRLFFNHPGWVGAWGASLSEALQGCDSEPGPPQVLFSAHSIPVAMARTCPYVEQVSESARLVAERTRLEHWQVVWQSRSGPPGPPWVGPEICEVIESSGAGTVVVVPLGFVCENMEVVHDLDVEAAAAARRAGARFVRARTVSNDRLFLNMVRQLVEERVSGAPALALGTHGSWPDQCPNGHCPPGPPGPPGPHSPA
ncbi:MAG TPA: ferrochelatase [Acidimicrobiales bacterium]|nr:ferrochelatase [Acidimicrobiales bacterium]